MPRISMEKWVDLLNHARRASCLFQFLVTCAQRSLKQVIHCERILFWGTNRETLTLCNFWTGLVMCEQPKAAALTEEELEDYFKWLGVLLEWINGSLVRAHPDKFLPSNMFILFDLNLHLIIFFFPWKENGVMLTALKEGRSTSLACSIA